MIAKIRDKNVLNILEEKEGDSVARTKWKMPTEVGHEVGRVDFGDQKISGLMGQMVGFHSKDD